MLPGGGEPEGWAASRDHETFARRRRRPRSMAVGAYGLVGKAVPAVGGMTINQVRVGRHVLRDC
jgi:hypothetical protein